jgi:2,3-diaminopropionate biosynthesis protein SbnA
MLTEIEKLSPYIGNTPLRELTDPCKNCYAKLEYNNLSGSSKDRAAYNMIHEAIKDGRINRESTVIASSSGNMAIAIATICKIIKIKFIPVIDPNINKVYEDLLKMISYKVEKVTKRDDTGGFLLTRIKRVSQMCSEIANSFCADQYCDPNNYKGYYGLANELVNSLKKLDLIFLAVSSGGTIAGVSKIVKSSLPNMKIIGVDIEGSVIFGQNPGRRYISGIGSSQRSPIMDMAIIDDVVLVSQNEVIEGCSALLNEQVIFAGASSGAVYIAAKKYLGKNRSGNKNTAVLVFPDRGFAYLDTIYNKQWQQELMVKIQEPV